MSFGGSFFILILAGTLAFVVVTERLLASRFDPFAPPFIFSVFMFSGYVLPYPFVIAEVDSFSLFWPHNYADFHRALNTAVLVASGATLMFFVGYNVAFRWLARPSTEREVLLDGPKLLRVACVYVLLSLVLGMIGIALLGGVNALLEGLGDRTRLFSGLNYFFSALTLPLGIALIYWLKSISKRRMPTALYWVFALCAALCIALTGAKSTIYVFAFSLLVLYHYVYQRIGLFKLAALGIALFVFLMAYQTFVLEYLAVGQVVSVDISSSDNRDLLLFLLDQFSGNFMQLQCLSILVDTLNHQVAMQWGKTLASLITSPIPSVFLADKPLTAPGVFTIALWPERWFEEGTTLPPGIIGEFYMNFGTAGALLGCFVWGASYGWAFRKALTGGMRPLRLIGYALYLALMLHYLRGEFVSPTVVLLVLFIPIWVACKYCGRPAKLTHQS